jgi:hypothetical protein
MSLNYFPLFVSNFFMAVIIISSLNKAHYTLADEVPLYVAADERIVELQGETLKVLNGLEAVVGHLRKFLVDHSVLPLFEKSVSLFLIKCVMIYGSLYFGILITLQCSFSVCCSCLTRSHCRYLA